MYSYKQSLHIHTIEQMALFSQFCHHIGAAYVNILELKNHFIPIYMSIWKLDL